MARKTTAHGKDLRKGRFSQTEQIYLVTTVTRDRMRWFMDLQLGRTVVAVMRYHHDRGSVKNLAFVVMPDHMHWLFALGRAATLSDVMGSVKGYSANRVNKLRKIQGRPVMQPIWQPGYHDHALRREEDIRAVARYIVANPLRAGLVDDIGRYPLWDAVWM